MGTERYAITDVGSNTTKVKIAERMGDGSFRQVLYKSYDIPLIGEKGSSKEIGEDAFHVFIEAMKEIHYLLESHNVMHRKAIGTEALRVAGNSSWVLEEVKKQTGADIEIISGHREAELTLRAVQIDQPGMGVMCINGGGGSTELCGKLPGGDTFYVFNFGAGNLSAEFFKDNTDLHGACAAVGQLVTDEFNQIEHAWIPAVARIVSIGGSVWAAAAFLKGLPEEDFVQLNGVVVGIDELEQLVDEIISTPVEEMAGRPFAPGVKRLKLLPAGLLVHTTLARLMNKDHITISTRSVADALMLEF